MIYYLFDQTYPGLLCCVFESFERKEFDVIPQIEGEFQPDFFSHSRKVITETEKVRRVQKALSQKVGKQTALDFFKIFLSEDRTAWQALLAIMQYIFRHGPGIWQNYGHRDVLYLTQILKKVNRERHRMKAFIRFQKSRDGLYVAIVEPDFNVLPLISDFFRKRYADQHWLIYDTKRGYGLLYDRQQVAEVQLSKEEQSTLGDKVLSISLDERDENFQRLWKLYYTSTNIESRRNLKLHLQHVPKRYWKYLTEKGRGGFLKFRE